MYVKGGTDGTWVLWKLGFKEMVFGGSWAFVEIEPNSFGSKTLLNIIKSKAPLCFVTIPMQLCRHEEI